MSNCVEQSGVKKVTGASRIRFLGFFRPILHGSLCYSCWNGVLYEMVSWLHLFSQWFFGSRFVYMFFASSNRSFGCDTIPFWKDHFIGWGSSPLLQFKAKLSISYSHCLRAHSPSIAGGCFQWIVSPSLQLISFHFSRISTFYWDPITIRSLSQMAISCASEDL